MAPYHALDNQGLPRQRSTSTSTKTASEMLSVSKDSHNVAKPATGGNPPHRRDWQAGAGTTMQAPTIRVIHIFAPKVIKTDMANFRSTVQKLTGRSTKKSSSQRRAHTARAKTQSESGVGVNPVNHPTPSPGVGGTFTGLWDQERSQKEVLQRLVGDACGTNPLVRSNSVESTYSLDSGNFSSDSNASNETDLPSPTADSFSFYVPQRESAYSLSEIPAPFFETVDMHPCYNTTPSFSSHSVAEHGLGLQLPTPVMDTSMQSMLSFDVDNIGTGLGSPLPLSDTAFDISSPLLGNGSSGSLYDILSVQQHCRLSVQQPFQGGNFFEMI